jgi:hypothetical protein
MEALISSMFTIFILGSLVGFVISLFGAKEEAEKQAKENEFWAKIAAERPKKVNDEEKP